MSFAHHNAFHFLRNKEMNEIYLSYGLLNLAMGLISVFVPIYLYKLGYSVPYILFYFAIVSFVFAAFSFWGAKIVSRLGVKHSMLVAMPILMIYFIGLRFLPSYHFLFYVLPIVIAVKTVIYNFSFHLNFIEHSDAQDRGRQVSMLQACAVFSGALSPFFGGMIIKAFGFDALFGLGAAILLLSIAPLLLTADIKEPMFFDHRGWWRDIFKKDNKFLVSSFAGYAVESWIGTVIWPIFMFVVLSGVQLVGFVAAVSTILTFLTFYFIGSWADTKDRMHLLKVGTLLYFFGWIGKIFVQNITSIILVDSYKQLAGHVLQIPLAAYSYDLASKTNYFKFIVQREMVYSLSRIAVAPILMLIFVTDYHPFRITFLVAAFASLFYWAIVKVNAGIAI